MDICVSPKANQLNNHDINCIAYIKLPHHVFVTSTLCSVELTMSVASCITN